jgi:hypothetical protein
MKTTTVPLKHSINCIFYEILLIPVALTCFALVPQTRAGCQDACLANSNTVQGANALANIMNGFSNTAFGANALFSVISASGNTAVGADSLYSDTSGYANTSVGNFSLFANTTGNDNTAVGVDALESNKAGLQNTAIGSAALHANMNASNNTANGYNALFNNTAGNNNTAIGSSAMQGNAGIQTTGSNNTAAGYFALASDTTGGNNTSMGENALANDTSGSNNIALGHSAGVSISTESNNIDVGNAGVAGDSGFIRIGTEETHTAVFIAGIQHTALAATTGVGITAQGQLGVRASSARYKEEIQPMDTASEAVLSLNPVSFRYKKELDPNGMKQFGLVAEEVAKVDADLVLTDADGKPLAVRYDEVNAMLLNEFLKEHRKVETLETKVANLEAILEKMTTRLETEQAIPHPVQGAD